MTQAPERPAEGPVHGMIAEFAEPEPLAAAARAAYRAGFRRMDAYTPFPVEEVSDAIGFRRDWVALITLLGGITGGAGGFLMQWYCNVIDYPINVAGRPYLSWPAFIPVTFELTVLGAAIAAAVGMMSLNHLPKPWHPVFNHPGFARASRDRFFLCIEARDPRYDPERIRALLEPLSPLSLEEVPEEESEDAGHAE